ncbi:ABC transporter ATP-binding protein [Desulfuribacillus alkaliarsenatis]|uniref:ABC transporter n=1 Tax=Desulfuribacillus alkaliarsenatis TaxID=766136 RepID=A0A1E5G2T9_9FIRM|nr:ABC transporter ATP-binding protein [Desulfuribacillus alkaliarsenatis]OEF97387.1 ABC transporter [Desulfuribacillus alkaliarsenatis]
MLKLEDVSKIYSRDQKQALKNINLEIKEGEFTALLGQNGAGKTTLINILAGNVKKSSGKVTIAGYDLDTNELDTKWILGIVPQEVAIDFTFSVEDILIQQSGYFGITDNKEYIDWLLESLALKDKKKSLARELSGGMKRRLLIAKALVHKPKILVLDEPTAGVDIGLRHTLYEFLEQLHKAGTTIILTTHYLEEAERLCERVVVINNGMLVADEPKDKLLKDFSQEINVEIKLDGKIEQENIGFLQAFNPTIKDLDTIVLLIDKAELTNILQLLIENDMKILDLNVERQKLEDVYLQLIKQ